ncbi:hypothetical protein BASA81_004029 [Batrachochytrium salamandrivorans]|nr:hypothetical protein BASA81_004029 [Batrachochytrium salamandrivorans]
MSAAQEQQDMPVEQAESSLAKKEETTKQDSAEETKETEEAAPTAFMHRVASGAASAAAVPARMFKSVMDQLRRPFAAGSLAHALRENLTMADNQRHFALLGEEFPDLDLESTHGRLQLHKYFGSGWGILLTHPKAFDPVSLTEFAAFASELGQFHQHATKLCALSTDTVKAHLEWTKDLTSFRSDDSFPPSEEEREGFSIPFMTDPKRTFAHRLGVLDTKEEDEHGEAMMGRAVFIVGPDRKLRFSQVYPHTCGRSVTEILRVLSALQCTENRQIAAPVGWTPGRALLVNSDVDLEVKDVLFPLGATEHHLPHQTIWSTPDPQVEERTIHPSAVEYKPQAHHVSMLNLGDELPNFHMKPVSVEEGSEMQQHESGVARYLEHCSWGIVCPLADPFSPVCLTELASALTHIKKFVSRKCKLVFLTANPIAREHIEDAIAFSQGQYHPRVLPFAVVLDPEREIIDGLGSLDEKMRDESGSAGVARGVFIVHGHDLKLRLSMLYPTSVARNWGEVLRVVDALTLTDASVSLLTPEGWTSGKECVADGTMKQDEVQTFFPESMTRPAQLASGKDYLVYVKDPTNVTSVH